MPKAAAATGCVDHVVSRDEIPDALVRALRTPEPAAR
jgi:chemotaxis response regulator CheB